MTNGETKVRRQRHPRRAGGGGSGRQTATCDSPEKGEEEEEEGAEGEEGPMMKDTRKGDLACNFIAHLPSVPAMRRHGAAK